MKNEVAKDKVDIFISNIDNKVILNMNIWQTVPINKNSRRKRFYTSCRVFNNENIHLEYLQYSQTNGDLRISFSVSRLFNGNNIIPVTLIKKEDFNKLLYSKLNEIIDITKLPPICKWIVSSEETFIDIIMDKNQIDQLFKVLHKIDKMPYLKRNIRFQNDGTLYFENKRTSIKVYYKILEQQQKNKDFDVFNFLNIKDNEDLLRFEVRNNRSKIKYEFKKNKLNCNNNVVGNIYDVLDIRYQFIEIYKFIKIAHLDKKITTKQNLYKIIDNSSIFTKNTKKTAKRVIRYLNREVESINASKQTIYTYKRKILNLGYHYMYADIDLDPINILNFFRNFKN